MGRPPGWATNATGRPAMRSPGHPPVARREHRQRFWLAIAEGLSSEDAATAAGVSPPVGTRWFREGGGMPTVSPAPLLGRYLSFVEREEIAILHTQGASSCEIARRLGSVDGLARGTPQRSDPWREAGVPSDHGAVACRPTREASEGHPARRPRPASWVRSGAVVRQDRSPRRGRGGWPPRCAGSGVDMAAASTDAGPQHGVQSRYRTG